MKLETATGSRVEATATVVEQFRLARRTRPDDSRRGTSLDLYLVSANDRLIRRTVSAGAAGVVIDWEKRGKHERQSGYDTQITGHTVVDLQRVRAATHAPVICRINPVGGDTRDEVRLAIDLGADEILIPMVRSPREVEQVLEASNGRARVGIMLETLDAIQHCRELACFPLSRVFVGLHDLAIERKISNPFRSLVDRLVDQIRPFFTCPFGFAGLTLPDRGFPIPSILILCELLRLRADFTFLRRSFLKDVATVDPAQAVRKILGAITWASQLPEEARRAARILFRAAVRSADAYFAVLHNRGDR